MAKFCENMANYNSLNTLYFSIKGGENKFGNKALDKLSKGITNSREI